MELHVENFIKRHQLLTEHATVLIGVSGGPDSLALLHFLRSIRDRWQLRLIAVSVDHQLRGAESAADLHYVEELCGKWGIDCVASSIDVASYQEAEQLSTEVAARALRYQCFAEQAQKYDADYVALGHHAGDQVETMLMTLARSASSSSFSGIPVKRPFGSSMIIRPLLSVTKDDIEAYLEKYQITPRIDSTNADDTYTRNYFRKHIVPLISQKNKNMPRTMQHLSETLAEDEDFLRSQAKRLVESIVYFDEKNQMASVSAEAFKQHHPALQRRSFHLILNCLYNELPVDLTYVHEAYFFSLLNHNQGNTRIDFPARLKLENTYGKIRFYFIAEDDSPKINDRLSHHELEIPGETQMSDGSSIEAVFSNTKPPEQTFTYSCLSGQVALPLHIRNRKPGDRMSWKGLNGTKKLKDLFIDAKIPLEKRDRWPLIVDNNGVVLWVIGLKKGQPPDETEDGCFIHLSYKSRNL